MEDLRDEELVFLYLNKGEERALEALIARYLKPIYNFIFRLSGGSYETEDLTEGTFIKAWRNLKRFNRRYKFSTWLFTIAKNVTFDFFRKKKEIPFSLLNSFSDQENENIEERIPEDFSLEEIINQDYDRKILKEAIEKLPLNYQMVIYLHYNDHLTFKEISEIFSKPLNTIKSWHFRALKLLKENINKKYF